MELRQLQYVVRIAEELNFSRAAEKLHIAQPSLSQQLAKLERELGVTLFYRNTNSVELTHAGEIFVERARKILDLADQLEQEMDDIGQMRKGKLIVGSLPITGSHILPLVLPVFKKNFPEIEIAILEETTTNLEKITANGQADICLLSLPIAEQSLTYETLIEEELCLAVPPSHPLAGKTGKKSRKPSGIKISSLANEPFIVLKKGQGFRQIVLDLCQENGFVPNIVFESGNIETAQSLVAAGMGIAFVPKMVTRDRTNPLAPVYLPFEEPKPTRTLVIAYRKGRYLSKAVREFISLLKEVVRKARL